MSRARRALLPALVFAVAFLTFWPGLSGEFVNWDDDVNFLANPNYRGLGWNNLRWMATTTYQGHWIPLSWLTLGVNYALDGMKPRGYHLGNLLLHGANATLFYWTARRLLTAAGAAAGELSLTAGAAFAALLFAVHPLRVESVVWITERRDVLSTLFFLASALGYLRAVKEGRDGRLALRWHLLSILAFVCAFMSKASTIMLPAALLLIDVYPLRRLGVGWRRLILEKLPYFGLAAADLAISLFAVVREARVTGLEEHGLTGRAAMVLYSFFFYPWKWVWPIKLSPMYEVPAHLNALAPRFLVPAAVVVLVSVMLVALRRRWPAGLAAWLYSALMILPLSGVVHVGYQLAQDRWSYRSGMGFALVMGGGLARLLDERARARVSAVITRTVLAGAAGIVFVLAAGAWDQSKIWQDSETLWRWAATLDPQCKMCWNNLGTALTGQQRHAEAEEAYRRAYAIRPYAAVANNIATALFNQGKTAQGEEMLREALHLDPDLTGALVNLGSQQARAGRFAEALPHLRRAYARDPVFPDAARVLTAALIGQAALELRSGRAPLAATLYREALAVQPGNAEAREGLDGLVSTRVPAAASDLRR